MRKKFQVLSGAPIILKAKQRLFTLVELLVILAIVAILASLMLPALKNVLSNAKRVSCASNLKQLMAAKLEYSEDHNGFLPKYKNAWDGERTWNIERMLVPYIGMGLENMRIGQDNVAGGIFLCASAPIWKYSTGTNKSRYNHDNVTLGSTDHAYCGNSAVVRWDCPAQRVLYYTKPSRAPWYFCSRGRSSAWKLLDSSGNYINNNDWVGASASWHDRWNYGARPTAFIDGHVRVLITDKYTMQGSWYLYCERPSGSKAYDVIINEY